MAVNDFTFNQLSSVLNSIQEQATGKSALAPVDTASFVTVAQETLKNAGYDPVLGAISQIMSKTIFANRPYERKFKGLQVSNIQYGNHVRKLNPIDKSFEEEARLTLTDGQTIDQYTVNKPGVLQTNFYGANIFEKSVTIFKDQLDSAFSGPNEFGQFMTMVMTNASDQIEQAHENVARATLANFMMGKIKGDTANVVHLVTEYKAAIGDTTLTLADLYKPDKFPGFMKWISARIMSISSLMTERSVKYHMNIANKEIMRHTPYSRQKVYLYAPNRYEANSMVLADTFHDNYLRLADNETVNFWQSIDTPDTINVQPIYLDVTTGGLKTESAAATQANIFGVIFDEEAIGYTVVNESVDLTPYNAKGRYWNQFWHFTDRYWNDFTENGVILLLD